jgi:hypothetical protein
MKKLTPLQMIAHVEKMAQNMALAKKLVVAVGLPKGVATAKIYGDGTAVFMVGYWHEYGRGNNPVRSFLRVPFKVKKNEITKMLEIAYHGVLEKGQDVKPQLSKVGAGLKNISQKAWENNGYGSWPALKASTKAVKGSSKPLFDTGTLKQSITYVVRNAS